MERRDDSERVGAARLFKELMGEAVASLPEEVTRLVIVPDGPLHKIPFDVLRPGTTGEPLAARFEISLAPSCSTWLRWTQAQRSNADIPMLAMADPLLRTGGVVPSSYRAATLASGLKLGPLPLAREEARSMVRSLGGGSRMVAGAEATERFLKTADLPHYRMLHLAAHTVVDDQHPERSAVLLAPGSDDEDGLLQVREIVGLDLKGRLVILSSCSSASGAVVEGEGVMGLARAFFQAGAVAVVGSLWPLRDEDAERLVDQTAVHLGGGASISAALAAARRDSIRAGAPAAAWAGLVVLGNGDFVPLPGGRSSNSMTTFFTVLTVALVLLGGALLVRRVSAPPA
jgi:CHAT domain-containing protein